MIKGLDGESFDDFQARYKEEFDTYVPLPVFPDIDYMELPATCQESTVVAYHDFHEFLDLLSAELTYETWLSEKLEECCEDLENQISSMVDEAKLDEFAESKEAKLNDLFLLNGEEGEERLDYYLRAIGEFEAIEDFEDIPTGLLAPEVPIECHGITPGVVTALDDFADYEVSLQECLNVDAWLDA